MDPTGRSVEVGDVVALDPERSLLKPSWSASSDSARERAPKSEARRELCRWKASVTLLPRRPPSACLGACAGTVIGRRAAPLRHQVSNTSRWAGSIGPRIRGALPPAHVECRGTTRTSSGTVEVLDAIDDPALAPQDPSTANREHLERRLEVVLGEATTSRASGADQDHLMALQRPRAACSWSRNSPPDRNPRVGGLGISWSSRFGWLGIPRQEVPRATVSSIGLLVILVCAGTHGPEQRPMS